MRSSSEAIRRKPEEDAIAAATGASARRTHTHTHSLSLSLSLSRSLLSLSYPNAVFSITSPRTVHFVTTKSAAVVSSVVAPRESRVSAAISIAVVAPVDARQPLQELLSVFFFSQRFSAGFFFSSEEISEILQQFCSSC
jgi:hypothetical protein